MNAMSFMVAQATDRKMPKLSATMRANPSATRRNEVRQAIMDCPDITEERIGRALGLGLPQVDRYVRMLIDGGEVVRVGPGLRAVE